ncbi:MAG: alanine dehydrogenase [Candidatus Marinimicrobia bacterium]|nr:alanine dehydrogenase [Candidatus Neomarinimicrobiota bacterium]
MIVGAPKEIKPQESRIAIMPSGVEKLTSHGHDVLVEHDGGLGCGFTDDDYMTAGAQIISTPAEIFSRADMIVKVKEPQPVELAMIREGQVIFTYFHFAASRSLTEGFRDTGATAIAYETVQLPNGELPLLTPMSEVAGRMAIQEGARMLEKSNGGRGVLLGGVPGVEPATVTVLGGGIVGTNSAKMAAGMGANVFILDVDIDRLRYLDDIMASNVTTLHSNPGTIRDMLARTDLLVGAVLVVGAKAPKLVTRDMLAIMLPGSVIVDVAVDQGGCVETCHPTTHEDPTFVVDGVIHYCVANMPGAVPNTSTRALTNSTFPYVDQLANLGARKAMLEDECLLKGLNVYQGHVTHAGVAEAFDLPYTDPATALG